MATMRRAWQPVNRRDAGDGEPDLVVGIESNVVGAGTASPPPQQTPVASSRGEGESAQPDPWAEWYRANPDSEAFSRHYGGPPLQPSSSGWNDQGWNYEQAPRQSTDQGWDDSEWDKGLKTGWLDDAQIRGFNVSNPRNTTAMNNGRWAGSYMTRTTRATRTMAGAPVAVHVETLEPMRRWQSLSSVVRAPSKMLESQHGAT